MSLITRSCELASSIYLPGHPEGPLAAHGMPQRHVALRLRHIVLQTELAGVLPVHKGEFQPIQQSALRWSNRLKQAVAVCNSLTMVNKNTVVGVNMERSMFKAVEALFLVFLHSCLQMLKGGANAPRKQLCCQAPRAGVEVCLPMSTQLDMAELQGRHVRCA